MSDKNNISLSGDEARLLMTVLASSQQYGPAITLFVKLNEINVNRPAEN